MLLPTRKPRRLLINGHDNAAIFSGFISVVKSSKPGPVRPKSRTGRPRRRGSAPIAAYTDEFGRAAKARRPSRARFHLSLAESSLDERRESRGGRAKPANNRARRVRFAAWAAPVREGPATARPC